MKNLVMNSEENQPITREFPVTSAQVFYAALSLICLLLFVQRFRNRRNYGRPTNLGGRQITTTMDSRKLLAEKASGKETTGTVGADQHPHQQQQQPMSNSPSREFSHEAVAPLPSACDILQPLSHCTPLPSSGHLAAMLSQERRARGGPIRPLLPKSASPKPKEEGSEKEASMSPLSCSPRPISTRRVVSGGSSPRPQGGGSEAKEETRNPRPKDALPGLSEPVKGAQSNAISFSSSYSSSSPPSTGAGAGTGEIPAPAATQGRRSSGPAAEKHNE